MVLPHHALQTRVDYDFTYQTLASSFILIGVRPKLRSVVSFTHFAAQASLFIGSQLSSTEIVLIDVQQHPHQPTPNTFPQTPS